MSKFIVRVRGSGCLIKKIKGRLWFLRKAVLTRVGFFATREVEASSEEEAGEEVSRMVRRELEEFLANPKDEPCSIEIDEIEERPLTVGYRAAGFTWFPEENS